MYTVRTKFSVLICVAALAAACGGSPTQPSSPGGSSRVPPAGGGSLPGLPLEKTSFMAFGDSLTAGEVKTFNGLLRIVVPSESYPTKLKRLLEGRHPGQQIEVYNEGSSGEHVEDPTTAPRFSQALTNDSPQVLLLLEGVNDLNTNGEAAIAPTIADLQAMISEARDRGVQVFVGTLLPQRPGAMRAYSLELIQPFNNQLKAMAAASGATVVDLYTPFAADLSLLGPDGLHPSPAGYTKMAQIWADAIDAALGAPLPGVLQPCGGGG
jgi:lysophospholipase L1-like esterase